MESKKLALLRILQILHMYSDIDHPLTQQEIGTLLVREYGIVLERKAIGRNLAFLREAGIDIAAFVQGCYLLDRLFEGSELRLLIDGVLSSKHISACHSKELIGKLCRLASTHFRRHVRHHRLASTPFASAYASVRMSCSTGHCNMPPWWRCPLHPSSGSKSDKLCVRQQKNTRQENIKHEKSVYLCNERTITRRISALAV